MAHPDGMQSQYPRCPFCLNNGETRYAYFVASQSANGGKTQTWTPVCSYHLKGWNDGGDWQAPVYRIGKLVTGSPLHLKGESN